MAEIRSTAWGFLARAGFLPHIQYSTIPLTCFFASLEQSWATAGKLCLAVGSKKKQSQAEVGWLPIKSAFWKGGIGENTEKLIMTLTLKST